MNSDPILRGKVVVVTGASKGIGAAIARRLVSDGASVALLARSLSMLTELADELGNDVVHVARCDIGDSDDVRAAFASVGERFGAVDALINNAGLIGMSFLADATDALITDMVSTNLLGAIFCSREAIPLIKESGGGHILNISSRAVELARPYLSVYSATKGGLEVFSRTLASELRPNRISVSIIRVGPTASNPIVQVDEGNDANVDSVTVEWVGRGGSAPEAPAPIESVGNAIVFVLTQEPGSRVPVVHIEPQ